jgi:hypothetical protein
VSKFDLGFQPGVPQAVICRPDEAADAKCLCRSGRVSLHGADVNASLVFSSLAFVIYLSLF